MRPVPRLLLLVASLCMTGCATAGWITPLEPSLVGTWRLTATGSDYAMWEDPSLSSLGEHLTLGADGRYDRRSEACTYHGLELAAKRCRGRFEAWSDHTLRLVADEDGAAAGEPPERWMFVLDGDALYLLPPPDDSTHGYARYTRVAQGK